MRASELLELVDDYNSYKDTPSSMEVKFGCDCGCGGDLYTSEAWDEEHRLADEYTQQLKTALESLGVVWDLVEED